MKQRFVEDNAYRFHIARTLLLLLFFMILSIFLSYIFSNAAFASRLQQTSRLITPSPVTQITPQPTVVPSPKVTSTTSSNTSSQDSQVQFENAIATLTIEVAGAVVAAVVLILAAAAFIAGIFGFGEFRSIKASRVKLENEVHRVEGDIELFKTRLQDLSKNFENESQTFMEASYQFSQGKVKYKDGDNEQAIAYYLEALKLQPGNPRILERLGRAYSNLEGSRNRDLAIRYLNEALKIDKNNEAALRGLALCYRDTDPETAYTYFHKCSGFEALDFLGLLYRDQQRFVDAIETHKKALEVHKETFGANEGPRPETLFYLSILYTHEGDLDNAKMMAAEANKAIDEPVHMFRLRYVWRLLIRSCYFIIMNNRKEALVYLEKLAPYVTSKPIYDGIRDHLNILLDATGHTGWKRQFLDTVKLRKIQRL